MSIVGEPTITTDLVIANSDENRDVNGNLAAGLLVRSDISNLSFQSSNGIISVNETGGGWLVLLSTSERVITVSSPGYLPKQLILSEYGISLSSGQVTQITLTSYRDGNSVPVSFEIQPAGTDLFIDGEKVDYSRLLMLTKGSHSVLARNDGYKDFTETITVSESQSEYQFKLELADLQSLKILTEPNGTDVYINGIYSGTTNANGLLEVYRFPGTYAINLIKSGYRPYSQSITLNQNANNVVNASLENISGTLVLSGVPVNAQVFIDRQLVEANDPINLAPGRHRLLVELNGYQSYTKELEVSLGQTLTENISLQVYSGSLSVTVNVQNTQVSLINDQNELVQQWFGNKNIDDLPEGNYLIRAKATNYNAQERKITIIRNNTQTIALQLNQNQGGGSTVSTPPVTTAPSNTNTSTQGTDYFVVVDEMPVLIGGMKKLYENLEYPVVAQRYGVEGRVTLQFIVGTDGRPYNVKVLKGIGSGCDREAIKAITNSEFEPGIKDGRQVRTLYTMPINFRLRR